MTPGAWVAVAAVAAALAFGFYRAATDGRFRGTRRVRGSTASPEEAAGSVIDGTPWREQLGDRATLLQFSSAFCAPCRAARRVLGDFAEATPGVVHLDVDAEHHLDLVRRLGVLRTPTTLVLDRSGREIMRTTGVPSRDVLSRVVRIATSED